MANEYKNKSNNDSNISSNRSDNDGSIDFLEFVQVKIFAASEKYFLLARVVQMLTHETDIHYEARRKFSRKNMWSKDN